MYLEAVKLLAVLIKLTVFVPLRHKRRKVICILMSRVSSVLCGQLGDSRVVIQRDNRVGFFVGLGCVGSILPSQIQLLQRRILLDFVVRHHKRAAGFMSSLTVSHESLIHFVPLLSLLVSDRLEWSRVLESALCHRVRGLNSFNS